MINEEFLHILEIGILLSSDCRRVRQNMNIYILLQRERKKKHIL